MPFIKTAAGKAWITLQIANYCWWCWQNYAGQHWAEQWAWARVVISVMTKKWQIFLGILWFFYFLGKNIHFLALIFKCLGKKLSRIGYYVHLGDEKTEIFRLAEQKLSWTLTDLSSFFHTFLTRNPHSNLPSPNLNMSQKCLLWKMLGEGCIFVSRVGLVSNCVDQGDVELIWFYKEFLFLMLQASCCR